MKFLMINGPNLNLLGKREPGIYGSGTYAELCALAERYAEEHSSTVRCFQSNHEGAIIDEIHGADGVYDALILNPGAYTHYSYAILDALKAVRVPAYEVHISHIDQREPFRAVSVTAPACVGQLYGLGFDGYLRAMDYFLFPEGCPRLCVIGDPVSHSLSPLLHRAMLSALGLEGTYSVQTVPRPELPAFLEQARRGVFTGFNATMPHKRDLVSLADELDESARRCGSVNTVCVRDGKLVGYSTDGPGYTEALRDFGLNPCGARITLMGAGGAARSVAAALADAGAGILRICNRTPSRAEELCSLAPERMIPAGLDPETLERLCGDTDLLINCTSLGMTGQGQFEDFSFLNRLPSGAVVSDLVYEPRKTELILQAEERGLAAFNGLPLLAWQGALALQRFLNRTDLDLPGMARAALDALDGEPAPGHRVL